MACEGQNYVFFLPVQDKHSCVQCLCTIMSEISELHFEAQAGAKSMCKVNGHLLWCISATSAFQVSCIGKPFLNRESMCPGSTLCVPDGKRAKQHDFARGGNNVIMGVPVTCLQLPLCIVLTEAPQAPLTPPTLFLFSSPQAAPTSTSSLSHKTALQEMVQLLT